MILLLSTTSFSTAALKVVEVFLFIYELGLLLGWEGIGWILCIANRGNHWMVIFTLYLWEA